MNILDELDGMYNGKEVPVQKVIEDSEPEKDFEFLKKALICKWESYARFPLEHAKEVLNTTNDPLEKAAAEDLIEDWLSAEFDTAGKQDHLTYEIEGD